MAILIGRNGRPYSSIVKVIVRNPKKTCIFALSNSLITKEPFIMNITAIKQQSLWRTAIIDLSLLAAACLVPTFSHLTALPLNQFNPMLLCLLAGMLLVKDRRNAYLLAVLLPVFSMLVVGMPSGAKSLLMAAEYLSAVALFGWISGKMGSRKSQVFVAMVAALLASKVVFYALKAVVLAPAVLITTPVMLQLLVVVAAAGLFALLQRR